MNIFLGKHKARAESKEIPQQNHNKIPNATNNNHDNIKEEDQSGKQNENDGVNSSVLSFIPPNLPGLKKRCFAALDLSPSAPRTLVCPPSLK